MENVEKHKYLLQPDVRSDKDKKFSSYLKVSNLVVPKDTDYRPKMPPIWDQGQLGACQSYAIDAIDQYIKGYVYTPSHIFTYYNTRLYEGSPLDQDTGGTLSGTCQAVKKYGICNSAIWPNDDSKFAIKPSDEAYADGLNGNDALVNFYRVETVDEARQALALGHLPYLGITVYQNFESDDVMKTGVIPFPEGEPLGGHALCFTKDTKVSLLDGRELNFEELINEYSDGKTFWVYSCDKNGRIVPGRAHDPRKTGNHQKILKVTLDDGEIIRCTENHKFLLRNGEYREAKSLIPGISLMPLYRKYDSHGYETYYNPEDGKYYYTHRSVVFNTQERYEKGLVVHHKNMKKRDNTPENLQLMTWDDHTALHDKLISEYNRSPEARERNRQRLEKQWQDPKFREENRLRAIKGSLRNSYNSKIRKKEIDPDKISFEEFLEERLPDYTYANHKVISVEEDGYEDVYDLTVDDYHNFALSSGVFVHNCIVGHHDNFTPKCAIAKFFYRNESKGYFIIRNSWGTGVGQQGYFICSYEVFEKLVMDMWIIVK